VLPIALAGVGTLTAPPVPELQGVGLGLIAFLITAVLGHPLLIPEVGAAFFVALGLCAGLAPRNGSAHPARGMVVFAAAAFYAVSLIWRLT
jgi:hypothetical protein